MTLDEALLRNPYNSTKGNLSAYCRYLRYTVDGFHNKTLADIKAILENVIEQKTQIKGCGQ